MNGKFLSRAHVRMCVDDFDLFSFDINHSPSSDFPHGNTHKIWRDSAKNRHFQPSSFQACFK